MASDRNPMVCQYELADAPNTMPWETPDCGCPGCRDLAQELADQYDEDDSDDE